ncbi:MAG: hypothetical protein CUN56_00040 [Phototrophicales bacterium]|nr:MAG: hypothetical protein CUN56_00040 [Phototrophicales bacterium]
MNGLKTRRNVSPLAKWGLKIFGIFVVAINAALTYVFSSTYLPAAFGSGVNIITKSLAGVYGLLMMDIGYLTWFAVYLKLADGRNQRSLSLLMAGASLFASIMATVNQLATNSYGLVDLAGYENTVGLIALTVMILITAAHIIASALFVYYDPDENMVNYIMDQAADIMQDVRADVAARMQENKKQYVELLARQGHKYTLDIMGITHDGSKLIGDGQDTHSSNAPQDIATPVTPFPNGSGPSIARPDDSVRPS